MRDRVAPRWALFWIVAGLALILLALFAVASLAT